MKEAVVSLAFTAAIGRAPRGTGCALGLTTWPPK